jgi:integrase
VIGQTLCRLRRTQSWVNRKEEVENDQQTQRGSLYQRHGAWHVRFRDYVRNTDGTLRKMNRSQRIASVKDYPRKTEVYPLVAELMARLNQAGFSPEAGATLREYVENIYFPALVGYARPSTIKGYRDIWRVHLSKRIGTKRVRDFSTRDGRDVLMAIAGSEDLARSTVRHIKSTLSAIFTFALNDGLVNRNPMHGVLLPKRGRESEGTHAYSLEEIEQMLAVLPDPAKTIVAIAAFAGLRLGELRGLSWDDYDGIDLKVSRSVWRSHVTPPKTRKSRAPVPVIGPLRLMIDACKPEHAFGPMFPNSRGGPIWLDSLAYRVIHPILKANGLTWQGWHSLRRGLATNLKRLGVPTERIQRILRHSNISVTQNSYILMDTNDAREAMKGLGEHVLKGRQQPVN